MTLTPTGAAALRAELLARAHADQVARRAYLDRVAGRVLPFDEMPALWAPVHAIDRWNTARMRQVLTEHGWPGHAAAGEDGSNAAWLIVQHAPLDLQEQALALLSDAVARGDASPLNLAYLTDRVRMHRGEPQVYGTQYLGRGETLLMHEVEDPEHLDERRAAVGLGPQAEYDAFMRERH
jgi:hypothetical protein